MVLNFILKSSKHVHFSTPSAVSLTALTCSGNDMKQHFDLTGKEGPAAVGIFPAYQVSSIVQHYLAHSALRYAKVGLTS